MQPLWLAYVIGIFVILGQNLKSENKDALIMVLGVAAIVVSAVLDILTSQNVINLPTLTTYTFVVFVLAIAVILANRFVRVHEQVGKLNVDLSKTNSAYQRFVPKQFLNLLGHKHIADVQIGDQVQRKMTILFSDIRSFTSLSETMTPQENFNFLNSYLRHITPIVRSNKGFIDKYIGDAVMALFPNSPEDAVKSAVAMQQDVNSYNEERSRRGDQTIAVGIGIHSGTLMLGTIGSEERMEGTVISDAVNLASRVEGVTKQFGVRIAVSEATIKDIPDFKDKFHSRYLGRVLVKGKNRAVAVYEILDGSPEDEFTAKKAGALQFATALQLYEEKNITGAKEKFSAVLAANPKDIPTKYYLKKIETILKKGIPENWSPVERLQSK